MQAVVKNFWVPKYGNTAEEYEDASASSTYRFAVADGATESSFAERWAQGLVKAFTSTPLDHIRNPKVPLAEWLDPLQKEWHKSVPWDRLPWYADEKARTGAFAAFLGVEILRRLPAFVCSIYFVVAKARAGIPSPWATVVFFMCAARRW